MSVPHCPFCNQPLLETRAGVQLPDLKARIFDCVQQAGDEGVTARDIALRAFGERRPKLVTIRVHINQINDMINLSGFRIIGLRESQYSTYRLVKVRHD